MTDAGEVAPDGGAPGLTLEAAPALARARKTRSGYLHKLVEGSPYEEIFARKIRVIKGWCAIGRKVTPPDLPPLDDAAKMVDWWQRRMQTKPPTRLLELRAAASTPTVPVAVVESAGAAPAAPAKSGTPRTAIVNFNDVVGRDLAASVERLQKTLFVLQSDHEKALCDPNTDEATLTLRFNRMEKCIDSLRKMEKALTDRQKETGDLIPRTELRAALAPLVESIAGSLVSQLNASFGIDRARGLIFVDEWFGDLRASKLFNDSVPRLASPVAA